MEDQEKTPIAGRGCLTVILVMTAAAAGLAAFGLWRVGGWDGFQRYLYKGSLNKVEQSALKMRPDGVSEAQINSAFDEARQAVDEERMNLDKLAAALKTFLEKHKQGGSKPSDGEMNDFLAELRAAFE